ncbi:MAG: hypothetical protein R6U78_17690 [Bacteroidales bacterium]
MSRITQNQLPKDPLLKPPLLNRLKNLLLNNPQLKSLPLNSLQPNSPKLKNMRRALLLNQPG